MSSSAVDPQTPAIVLFALLAPSLLVYMSFKNFRRRFLRLIPRSVLENIKAMLAEALDGRRAAASSSSPSAAAAAPAAQRHHSSSVHEQAEAQDLLPPLQLHSRSTATTTRRSRPFSFISTVSSIKHDDALVSPAASSTTFPELHTLPARRSPKYSPPPLSNASPHLPSSLKLLTAQDSAISIATSSPLSSPIPSFAETDDEDEDNFLAYDREVDAANRSAAAQDQSMLSSAQGGHASSLSMCTANDSFITAFQDQPLSRCPDSLSSDRFYYDPAGALARSHLFNLYESSGDWKLRYAVQQPINLRSNTVLYSAVDVFGKLKSQIRATVALQPGRRAVLQSQYQLSKRAMRASPETTCRVFGIEFSHTRTSCHSKSTETSEEAALVMEEYALSLYDKCRRQLRSKQADGPTLCDIWAILHTILVHFLRLYRNENIVHQELLPRHILIPDADLPWSQVHRFLRIGAFRTLTQASGDPDHAGALQRSLAALHTIACELTDLAPSLAERDADRRHKNLLASMQQLSTMPADALMLDNVHALGCQLEDCVASTHPVSL
ncbi:hypothetical protein RI367_000906 [Sorochytrium milnesiophthora]